MQNYTVLDCCLHWSLSEFSQALCSIGMLTGLTELRRESGTCAVGAGLRAPSWSPFKFSSCPARIVARVHRLDRPTCLTFECSSQGSTGDCFSVKTHLSCPLSQASSLLRCFGTCCRVHAGLSCFLVSGLLQLRLDFESSAFGFAFGCLTAIGQFFAHLSCRT